MRLIRSIVLAALCLATAVPAYADFTFIVGSNTTPSKRTVKGFALGGGGMIATEFEYANNGQDTEDGAPGLRTLMGNLLVQTPIAVAGFQPYATVGIGYYREKFELDPDVPAGGDAAGLSADHQESGLVFNSGVGVKRNIFGPLKVRIDYRVLKLRGEPLYGTVHRVYSGVHLAF